jgi:geranylgeranyl diphosphate synthase type I
MIQTNSHPIPQLPLLLNQCEEEMVFRLQHSAPSLFHLNSGGNRSRAKLCIDAGIALELPNKAIIALACSIELLHNASLVHDDLQDCETTRRGRQSVWKKYGKSHAICTGDTMISAAYGTLADIGAHPALSSLLLHINEAVSITIQGQSRDIDASSDISEQQYEEIAAMKSGPLIQLTLGLPLLMSGHEHHVNTANKALHKFAIAYQIVDDLNDWQQDLQHKHLNLINLLATTCSVAEAISFARKRAQYLLMQCERELKLLPANCANSVIKASQKLLLKANEGTYE